MGLVLEVLQIVAPVFILAGIGYTWVRVGLEYKVEFVTRLTMTLAIPCLIFTALVRSRVDPVTLRDTALAALAAYVAVGLGAWAMLRLRGMSLRTFLPPLTFGNTGNLGLPLALFAFGNTGFDFAVVVFAVMAILSFTAGVWVVSGNGSPLLALKEPMFGASVLGGVFLMEGWGLPVWVMNTLDLVGQIGIPLMLITLGVAISRLHPGAVGRAAWLSLFKMALCVAVALGAGLWFGLPPVALGVLVLQVSTPVAVTNYMLAEKYGANSGEVAGLVVVSTLMSVAAIPAILAFFI